MFQSLKTLNPKEENFFDMDLKSSKRGFHKSPGTTYSVVKGNETRLRRCVNCGFVCDTERDVRLPEDSWAGLGISYSGPQTANTSIGDAKYPILDSNVSLMIDCSPVKDETGKTITSVAVTTNNSLGVFGGGAAAFDGSTSYLSIPTSSSFNSGSGSFTGEAYVAFNSTVGAQVVMSRYLDNSNKISLQKNLGTNKLVISVSVGGSLKALYTMTNNWTANTNQMYHLAFERVTTSAAIYINGQSQPLDESIAFSTNDINFDGTFYIGQTGASTGFLNGWADKIRFSKVARYTSNFIPKQYSAYKETGADIYYNRTVRGGCPSCGSFIYDKKPNNQGSE